MPDLTPTPEPAPPMQIETTKAEIVYECRT